MEWMLQVADEIDDLCSMAGYYTLSLRSEWQLLLAGSIGFGTALFTA